jgi:hypothetical protein
VSGGLGHGGKAHVANEYMTVKGLKDFEMFVASFLYAMADQKGGIRGRKDLGRNPHI